MPANDFNTLDEKVNNKPLLNLIISMNLIWMLQF